MFGVDSHTVILITKEEIRSHHCLENTIHRGIAFSGLFLPGVEEIL